LLVGTGDSSLLVLGIPAFQLIEISRLETFVSDRFQFWFTHSNWNRRDVSVIADFQQMIRLVCDIGESQRLDRQAPHKFYFGPRFSHGSLIFETFHWFAWWEVARLPEHLTLQCCPGPFSCHYIFGSIIYRNLTSFIADRMMASISDGDFSLLIGFQKLDLTAMIFSWHHISFAAFISRWYAN
jgi:hypothetical protein